MERYLYKNKEWLYQKYVVEELTAPQIGKICNCVKKTIYCWLKKYSIKIRNASECRVEKLHHNFGKRIPIEKHLFKHIDKKDNISECWIWTGYFRKSGHGQIRVNNRTKSSYVAMYEYFYKIEIPKGSVVHHVCENPKCCNPFHLIIMTDKEHKSLHHKYKRCGERHPMAKLKEWQVIEIRIKYRTGKYTQKQLAKEYNVGRGTIVDIVKNKTWRM